MIKTFLYIIMCFSIVSCFSSVQEPEDKIVKTKEVDMARADYATIGGGCFWCLEAVFEKKEGIISVTSGYAGGTTKNPSYNDVCTGNTGHAEVVQIAYNPDRIQYKEILDLFFKAHDPTTLNRQGADVGTQYRSIILYHTEGQKKIAEETIKELENRKMYKNTIVTEIKSLEQFYKAEEYHQNYFAKHPNQAYCRIVIAPKLKKLGY